MATVIQYPDLKIRQFTKVLPLSSFSSKQGHGTCTVISELRLASTICSPEFFIPHGGWNNLAQARYLLPLSGLRMVTRSACVCQRKARSGDNLYSPGSAYIVDHCVCPYSDERYSLLYLTTTTCEVLGRDGRYLAMPYHCHLPMRDLVPI